MPTIVANLVVAVECLMLADSTSSMNILQSRHWSPQGGFRVDGVNAYCRPQAVSRCRAMDRGRSADQPGRRSAYQVTTRQGDLGGYVHASARRTSATRSRESSYGFYEPIQQAQIPICRTSVVSVQQPVNVTGRVSDHERIRSGRDKVGGARHLIGGGGEIADYCRSSCPPEKATLHRCPKRKARLLTAVKNGDYRRPSICLCS
ncbi:hypothetical protein OKW27_001281 [Paraburkholderia sp. 35.1]